MKYYAIALFAVLMSSGCSTTEGGRVFTLADNVHSEESQNIPNTKTKKFSFKISGISQQEVKDKIIADLKEQVAVKITNQPIQARKKADAFSDVVTSLNQQGNNTKIKLYADIKWRITEQGLLVSYESNQDYESRKALAYQRFVIDFDFSYDEKTELLTLTITTPDKYLSRNGNLGGSPMIIPPYDETQFIANVLDTFNSLHIDRIGYQKEKTINGDFIVNYKDDSVYANFIQLGVNNTTEHKIEKTASIFLKKGDMQYVTNVSVYPYRDTKTKVVYECHLKSAHWLNSDGTVSFEKFPEQKEIEKMLWDIANK
jgi:hypothetical protein